MIEQIRLKSHHVHSYKPNDCDSSVVTGIFWDYDKGRMAVSVIYDNGTPDWIPLIEILGGNYTITNNYKQGG